MGLSGDPCSPTVPHGLESCIQEEVRRSEAETLGQSCVQEAWDVLGCCLLDYREKCFNLKRAKMQTRNRAGAGPVTRENTSRTCCMGQTCCHCWEVGFWSYAVSTT